MSRFITECVGDMFQSDAEVYGHGVNTVGAMGAGIAAQFRANYPEMYEQYRHHCVAGTLTEGKSFVYVVSTTHWVANIASQDMPGPAARYEWLMTGLAATYNAIKLDGDPGFRLALPQIGCGIGGLDWNIVKVLITEMAEFYKVETELWTYGN